MQLAGQVSELDTLASCVLRFLNQDVKAINVVPAPARGARGSSIQRAKRVTPGKGLVAFLVLGVRMPEWPPLWNGRVAVVAGGADGPKGGWLS